MKETFTIFNKDDSVYGYLHNKTRSEAQEIVAEINEKTKMHHYYIEGYYES